MNARLGTVAGVAVMLTVGVLTAPAPAQGRAEPAPWCTNAALKASYRPSDSGAGQVWGWMVLRNRSDHPCRVGGFGGIAYVGNGDGTQIGAAADRTGTATTYLLDPGDRVRSRLQETRSGNYPRSRCRPRHVDGFRVYVPDATRSQYVAHPTTGCRNAHVHLLTHMPYRRP
jgi:hypothetical protein